jgi:Bacterial archaeo-eukaryotic release factor family 2
MSSTGTATTDTLAEIFRTGGDWSEVYLDVSVDTGDPAQVTSTRAESVSDTLRRAGAPQSDVEAVEQILREDPGVTSPVCRFILVQDGTVAVNQVLVGVPVEQEVVSYGPVPNVVPLLRHKPEGVSYLVVETSREGGEVRLYRAGEADAVSEDEVKGKSDRFSLHKAKAGGWRQSHNQSHAEEVWKQTQSDLAASIDDIVRKHRPRLLVVAGDVRATQLLAEQLSSESQAILSVEPTNTRADGASDDALVDHINEELDRVLEEDTIDAVDKLAIHQGRGDNTVETSAGAIVMALASAQVDTLIIDTAKLGDNTLLALDAEPWIASAPEETLGAGVLGDVPAPVAMVRAAVLTDAKVLFVDPAHSAEDDLAENAHGNDGANADEDVDTDTDENSAAEAAELPEGVAVAALLRWRTGPPVPGT